jgi:hypothetical protein
MHPEDRVRSVIRFVGEGLNDCEISRRTGVPRRTVLDWRHGRIPGRKRASRACPRCHGAPLDEPAYAYLLGLYLGDGCISPAARCDKLRIFQDARYVDLISLARRSLVRVRGPQTKVGTTAQGGCVEIYAHWQHWVCLFPQHAPGRRHNREIRLEGWQRAVVGRYPRQLLRGLIHSDGCRVMNRVHGGKYSYARYLFTNRSEDILGSSGELATRWA